MIVAVLGWPRANRRISVIPAPTLFAQRALEDVHTFGDELCSRNDVGRGNAE